MDWNIEVRVTAFDIETLDKEQAFERARLHAWRCALADAHPKRSLVLCATEETEHASYGSPCISLRFRFEVE